MKLKKTRVKNTRDRDIYIRDALGIEHILFPNQEKIIIVLEKKKKNE